MYMIEYERSSPIILSGPSASGKSYMARKIEEEYAVTRLTPVMTRAHRPDEIPGVDGIFMDDLSFEKGVADDEIILPSGHLGTHYGYSSLQVQSILENDRIPLLEVYSPKVEKVLGHFATTRTVFLQPSSVNFLESRMIGRGQTRDEIEKRMLAIHNEIAFFEDGGKNLYNYIYKVDEDTSDTLHRTVMSDLGIDIGSGSTASMLSPQDIAKAYDRAATQYESVREKWDNEKLLNDLCSRLPQGSRILDVGCGSGTPIAQGLVARGMNVRGIDISEGQIKSALSKRIDNATFEVKNMHDIDYDQEFDGVACFYSIYHIERQYHAEILAKLAKSLKKNGVAMILFGVKSRAAHTGQIAGAEMVWSNHDMKTNLELVEDAELSIECVFIDTAGDERHQVIIAKK